MKTGKLAHQRLKPLSTEEVLEAVERVPFQNRRCVEAFLDRCQEEMVRNPRKALALLVEAPEYVRRCGQALGNEFSNYLVRAHSVLGSGLALCGSVWMARHAFNEGLGVSQADPLELVALRCRAALMEVRQGNWRLALEMTNDAVAKFEVDRGRVRDDRSLATALVYRGMVRGCAYTKGEDVDLNAAVADYQRSLACSVRRLKRTRRAAVAGIGACAVAFWFSGRSTRVATPQSVVETMKRFRAALRREDVTCDSVIDARARWILGLALWKLLGGLGPYAERHLREGRDVLMEIGSHQDVAELTFDLQWCLIEDARWAAALAECALLENLCGQGVSGWTMATVLMWRDALARRSLDAKLVRQVFFELRGVRDVSWSRPEDSEALIGF